MNQGNIDRIELHDNIDARVARGAGLADALHLRGRYLFTCTGPREQDRAHYCWVRDEIAKMRAHNTVARVLVYAKRLAILLEELDLLPIEAKWDAVIDNMIVTEGKNLILDSSLSGVIYTATNYFGLVDGAATPTYALTDTMGLHPGWAENTNYTSGTRVSPSWAAATGGSKSLSAPVAFAITSNGLQIAGGLIATDSTKGGASGVLLSVGSFTTGNKPVNNGDTISISYTLAS